MNISNAVLNIKIEDIVPNRFQPREHFADDGIEELAASIKEHGIIQPLVLRKLGDKFEIVAGERRYKAATLAGLTHVPAIISDIDDNKSAEVALVENIQRRNLTSIEEARSYKAILDKGYLTQEQLAAKMGVSQSQIANKLRLLNLCDEVQEALMNQKISERHARALLGVYDFDEQRKWLNRIIKERLTVRQLDLELKKLNAEKPDESEIVPLVNINQDVDSIRQNATDIIQPEVKKDVSSFMIPDENFKNFKIEEPAKEELEVEEIKEEETEEPLNTSRFFNFLEDEGPNMNMEEPMSDNKFFNFDNNNNNEEFINPFNNPQPDMNQNIAVENNVNVAPVGPEPMVQPMMQQPQPMMQQPQPMVEPQVVPQQAMDMEQPAPGDNMMYNQPVAEPMPQTPVADAINPFATSEPAVTINPFLEENPFIEPAPAAVEPAPVGPEPMVQPTMEMAQPMMQQPQMAPQTPVQPEPMPQMVNPAPVGPLPTATEITNTPGMVNPMDNINNLNQPANVNQPVNNGPDINGAINDIRNLVSKLESQGFYIRLEELALPNGYQINININN